MKGRPTEKLVYEQMFRRLKSSDPPNFASLLERCLIPEVRHEVQAFFGHLETQEAKYPGLDYNHPTHRLRLSRWPWHARLFKAFDVLGLTKAEVWGLTKWEGTKWAKEKYEKEQGVKIRDTTADGFPDWVEPEDRPLSESSSNGTDRTVEHGAGRASTSDQEMAEDDDEDEEYSDEELGEEEDEVKGEEEEDASSSNGYAGEEDGGMEDDSDEEPLQSVGEALNQRLRDRVARLEAGETSVVMDEEWDQWFKNALESGELAFFTEQITQQMLRNNSSVSSSTGLPAGLIPSSWLESVRAGQWDDIPEALQPILRRTVEPSAGRAQTSAPAGAASTNVPPAPSTPSIASWPRPYSELRFRADSDAATVQLETSPPGA